VFDVPGSGIRWLGFPIPKTSLTVRLSIVLSCMCWESNGAIRVLDNHKLFVNAWLCNAKSHIKLGGSGKDKRSPSGARVHSACLPSSEKPKYYASDEREPNYATNDTSSNHPCIGFLL